MSVKDNVKEILGTDGISGTFGEVWLDGDYVGELEGFQAKIDFEKAPVPRPRHHLKAHKTIGAEGKGSLTMTKVSSRMTKLRSEEHTSELQSRQYLVCRLLLEKKK